MTNCNRKWECIQKFARDSLTHIAWIHRAQKGWTGTSLKAKLYKTFRFKLFLFCFTASLPPQDSFIRTLNERDNSSDVYNEPTAWWNLSLSWPNTFTTQTWSVKHRVTVCLSLMMSLTTLIWIAPQKHETEQCHDCQVLHLGWQPRICLCYCSITHKQGCREQEKFLLKFLLLNRILGAVWAAEHVDNSSSVLTALLADSHAVTAPLSHSETD